MKALFCSLFVCLTSLLSFATPSSPTGETASYTLNGDSSRTSWMIKEGEGTATVKEMRNDPKVGPAYVVDIDYYFDVMFKGEKRGTISLLVPAAMFGDEFYDNLKVTHPVDVGSFKVDYMGMSRARDNENNAYDQCMMIKIFDVNTKFRSNVEEPRVTVLSHVTTMGEIDNIVLNMKTHDSVPVLGAVQIDMSGTASGINVKAGFDFMPN